LGADAERGQFDHARHALGTASISLRRDLSPRG
jgi:hypothetical protein